MQHLLLCFEKIKARQFSSTDPWFRIEAPITTSDLRSWPFLFYFLINWFFFYKNLLFSSGMNECSVTSVMSNSLWPYGLSGSSVHGILQARILEWVAISFSRGSSRPRDWTHVSCIAGRLFTNEPPGKSFISEYSWLIMWQFQLSHTHTCIHSLPKSPAIQAGGAGLLKH